LHDVEVTVGTNAGHDDSGFVGILAAGDRRIDCHNNAFEFGCRCNTAGIDQLPRKATFLRGN
jgi:hypothetical protein